MVSRTPCVASHNSVYQNVVPLDAHAGRACILLNTLSIYQKLAMSPRWIFNVYLILGNGSFWERTKYECWRDKYPLINCLSINNDNIHCIYCVLSFSSINLKGPTKMSSGILWTRPPSINLKLNKNRRPQTDPCIYYLYMWYQHVCMLSRVLTSF